MMRTDRGASSVGRKKPVCGTRCSVVLSPYTPQKCGGSRSEPARSEPTSSGVMPLASAAVAPPLEPPGVRAGSHGLAVRPKTGLALW